jgi:DNA-binding transcriptional ArsR family regulator
MSSTNEDRLDALFHALAVRPRRQLLARLHRAPASIGELAAPFDMSLPAVSKHIRVLERAGLVKRAVSGRVHTCTLHGERLRAAAEWLDAYRELWDDTLAALAEFVERKQ